MKKKYAIFLYMICFLVFIIFNAIYFIQFNSGLSTSSQDYANYGGYIGGAVVPFFTFVTIILALKTMETQQKNFQEQIVLQKKDSYSQRIYSHIESLMEKIVSDMYYKIDPRDLYELLRRNDAIAKGIYEMSGKNIDEFKSESKDKFIEKNSNSNELTVINLISSMSLCRTNCYFEYEKLDIPKNIEYRIELLSSKINHLAFLISDLNIKNDMSIIQIKILINPVLGINELLLQCGIYKSDKYPLYQFYETIKNSDFDEKLTIDRAQFIEVKALIFKEFNHKNLNKENITFEEFVLNHIMVANGSVIEVYEKSNRKRNVLTFSMK